MNDSNKAIDSITEAFKGLANSASKTADTTREGRILAESILIAQLIETGKYDKEWSREAENLDIFELVLGENEYTINFDVQVNHNETMAGRDERGNVEYHVMTTISVDEIYSIMDSEGVTIDYTVDLEALIMETFSC